MFSQVIAVALAAFVAQPVMASSCTRSYTVKAGDICDSISAANNVSTYQLAVYNLKKVDHKCSNLEPGSTLCLGKKGADCKTTHVVSEGDTCDSISQAAGVNNTILNLNNPQINDGCTNIYLGEVLCTAKTVDVPHAPASGASVPIPSPSPSSKAVSGSLSQGSLKGPSKGDNGDDEEDLPYCDEL